MIERIIRFAVQQKLLIAIGVLGLIGAGVLALQRLPIDAVPDITNNQVQIVTTSAYLAPQEVEQFITYPVEVAMANIPDVIEVRSISRFGLSVVTVVFEDHVPILEARQYVKEQIAQAEADIPGHLGTPQLMPITTGLGEIYQYVLRPEPGYEHQYGPMQLRTIQDWIVKRQLAGIDGIVEVSSFGGYLKQYEVALDPQLLQAHGITIGEVYTALEENNQNSGGSYIEKETHAYYIRTEGLVQEMEDIEQIAVATRRGIPVLIRDLGRVRLGAPKRYGAMTMDGQGEAVGGITLMLKGANSSVAIENVHDRIEEVKASLPEGVELYPYLDRSVLVGKTIRTVRNNLLEGGLIVIAVLFLMLGNWRGALIVASIIPLSMLFALILMNATGLTANLMSLGAIDFGIVVDGAVIIVEGVLHALVAYHAGRVLSRPQMDEVIIASSARLFRSAIFGVFIILVVFVPIITLTGIEGKMFRPMALTFSFVVLGALILSLTYVPAASALLLSRRISGAPNFSDRFMNVLKRAYYPALAAALRRPFLALGLAAALLAGAIGLFSRLGAEFIPTLEEGDLAMQMTIPPGSSLQQSVASSSRAERILLNRFPEVEHVVSKIGTAEVPTDPMAIEDADIMIIMKEKAHWTTASTREALVDSMKKALAGVPAAAFEFTQPIELRFNELLSGSKSDVAVKIFGEDPKRLKELADEAAALIDPIPGAADVRVEQTEGLQQLVVRYKRERMAEHGLHIADLNRIIRAAFAGAPTGYVFENERRFELVLRLDERWRQELNLAQLYATGAAGQAVPLSEVASVQYVEGPMQISRENARRRISVGINVRGRDLAGLVAEVQQTLAEGLTLPPGYSISYGGDFENLQAARKRLGLAVPISLALIFILLFFTFGTFKYALLIITAVPMAAIGGILALWIRAMPFSISAGVGFIALFGVAVLNGIVLISRFNQLREENPGQELQDIILQGSRDRLRPVLITAITTIMGFVPMATSTSNGAEVQRPLATVVIGGLLTATLLTLFILPVLYQLVNRSWRKVPAAAAVLGLLLAAALPAAAQPVLTLDSVLAHLNARHPELAAAGLRMELARWESEVPRQVPPTRIAGEFGQINTPLVDYRLNLVQPIGQPLVNKRRRALAEAEAALAGQDRRLLALRLQRDAAGEWYRWWYEADRGGLLQAQADLYAGVLSRSRQQLDAGEGDRVGLMLTQSRLQQLEVERTNQQNAVRQALADLLATAQLRGNFQPPDGRMGPLPFPDTSLLETAPLDRSRQAVAVAGQATDVARMNRRPEWGVGYFFQSIRPNRYLQGGLLEVSVPLFQKPAKARQQQAALQQEIRQQEFRQTGLRLRQERRAALDQASALYDRLQAQGNGLMEQARELRRLGEQLLDSGEVDFFRYYQLLDLALENELAYLELVHRYNQAVIRLGYYYR